MAGPYHFTPEEPDYKDMFGPPDRYKHMQVTTYIDGKEPPMLLLWGEDDKTVGEENIINLKKGLDKTGGKYEIKYYPGVDHIDIVAAMAQLAKGRAPVINDVNNFFKSYGSSSY